MTYRPICKLHVRDHAPPPQHQAVTSHSALLPTIQHPPTIPTIIGTQSNWHPHSRNEIPSRPFPGRTHKTPSSRRRADLEKQATSPHLRLKFGSWRSSRRTEDPKICHQQYLPCGCRKRPQDSLTLAATRTVIVPTVSNSAAEQPNPGCMRYKDANIPRTIRVNQ